MTYLKITKGKYCGKSSTDYLIKQLIFSELNTIFLEGYMDIVFYTYLTLHEGIKEPIGESLSYGLAWFALTVLTVYFLYSFIKLLLQDEKTLKGDDKEAHEKYMKYHGELIADLKFETKAQRLFYPIFMARRIVYLAIVLNYPDLTEAL